jgi:hypothetical protein
MYLHVPSRLFLRRTRDWLLDDAHGSRRAWLHVMPTPCMWANVCIRAYFIEHIHTCIHACSHVRTPATVRRGTGMSTTATATATRRRSVATGAPKKRATPRSTCVALFRLQSLFILQLASIGKP